MLSDERYFYSRVRFSNELVLTRDGDTHELVFYSYDGYTDLANKIRLALTELEGLLLDVESRIGHENDDWLRRD